MHFTITAECRAYKRSALYSIECFSLLHLTKSNTDWKCIKSCQWISQLLKQSGELCVPFELLSMALS